MLINNRPNGQEFDIIHVEHLRGSQYGIYLKDFMLNNDLCIPIVWDSVDNISHLFRQSAVNSKKRLNRWITRFELGRTEKYENRLIEQFDKTLVTSNVDKDCSLNLGNWRIY